MAASVEVERCLVAHVDVVGVGCRGGTVVSEGYLLRASVLLEKLCPLQVIQVCPTFLKCDSGPFVFLLNQRTNGPTAS